VAPATAASPRLPALSEAELTAAYRGGSAGPVPLLEPCACGELVVCVSDDIVTGLRAHQAGNAHRAWRDRGGLDAPTFDVRTVGSPMA
jgi:hypothetical protein